MAAIPDWTEIADKTLVERFVVDNGLILRRGDDRVKFYYNRPTTGATAVKYEDGKYYVRTIPFIVWLGRGEE